MSAGKRVDPKGEAGAPPELPRGLYVETDRGIVWRKGESEEVLLTNFKARIGSQVQEDDGVAPKSAFEIVAELRSREKTFLIPATTFAAMNWPLEQLGAEAIVYPGQGIRDRARTAVQILSGEVPSKRVFVHTGWTELEDGESVYLHGDGAIGPRGTRHDVEVRLSEALSGFRLPEVPGPAELKLALEAVFRVLDVAPRRITVPLLSTVFRSVFGRVDYSLNLVGPSGSCKSELAALAQRHFGPTMDARNLPASWTSTANALEMISFLAKDALLVVDDYAPGAADSQNLARTAERLLRATGNGSGRQRMTADASLRTTRQPRASLLSTGEDVFRGHSVRARTLTLHLEPDDVSLKHLSISQLDGNSGLFAKALAAFIQRLAGRLSQVRKEMPARLTQLREKAITGQTHRRTPDLIANLFYGWESLLQFAHEAGVLTSNQVSEWRTEGWSVLGEAGAAQAFDQADSDPASQFLRLLRTAMGAGLAHVARGDSIGGAPENALSWGWKKLDGGGFSPNGMRIGWLDADGLFLDGDTAHLAASTTLAKSSASETLSTAGVLKKRLRQAKLLVSVDSTRETLTVRRCFDGTRKSVLHLRRDVLDTSPAPEEPAQPAQMNERESLWSENPPRWSGAGQADLQSPATLKAQRNSELHSNGRVGQVSTAGDRGGSGLAGDSWSGSKSEPAHDPTSNAENPTTTSTTRVAS